MIHFAVTDNKPALGAPKVRYFAAPDCALVTLVEQAVVRRMSAPVTLTFLTPIQSPQDNRLIVLAADEVCS